MIERAPAPVIQFHWQLINSTLNFGARAWHSPSHDVFDVFLKFFILKQKLNGGFYLFFTFIATMAMVLTLILAGTPARDMSTVSTKISKHVYWDW